MSVDPLDVVLVPVYAREKGEYVTRPRCPPQHQVAACIRKMDDCFICALSLAARNTGIREA